MALGKVKAMDVVPAFVADMDRVDGRDCQTPGFRSMTSNGRLVQGDQEWISFGTAKEARPLIQFLKGQLQNGGIPQCHFLR